MFIIEGMSLREPQMRSIENLFERERLEVDIQDFYSRWRKTVGGHYTCLVLDYDGTLRETGIREGPIDSRLTDEICRLGSTEGIRVIVATGRRSSAMDLGLGLTQSGLPEVEMVLGNGSEVMSFPSGETMQLVEPFTYNDMSDIQEFISSGLGFDMDNIYASRRMIRVFVDESSHHLGLVQSVICETKNEFPQTEVTHSGLNIEIVPRGARKETAIRSILEGIRQEEVLAVGDSCSRHGNDYGLLTSFPSFSVGARLATCAAWTLPVVDDEGTILDGPKATHYLLIHLSIAERSQRTIRIPS